MMKKPTSVSVSRSEWIMKRFQLFDSSLAGLDDRFEIANDVDELYRLKQSVLKSSGIDWIAVSATFSISWINRVQNHWNWNKLQDQVMILSDCDDPLLIRLRLNFYR